MWIVKLINFRIIERIIEKHKQKTIEYNKYLKYNKFIIDLNKFIFL